MCCVAAAASLCRGLSTHRLIREPWLMQATGQRFRQLELKGVETAELARAHFVAVVLVLLPPKKEATVGAQRMQSHLADWHGHRCGCCLQVLTFYVPRPDGKHARSTRPPLSAVLHDDGCASPQLLASKRHQQQCLRSQFRGSRLQRKEIRAFSPTSFQEKKTTHTRTTRKIQ